MAKVPELGCEDEDFYYFAGGTRAHIVNDFSTGIAIAKANGVIFVW